MVFDSIKKNMHTPWPFIIPVSQLLASEYRKRAALHLKR